MSRINPGVKIKLLEACNYTCAVCEATAYPRLFKDQQGYRVFDENGQMTKKAITVDHIIPKSKGGTNRQVNLIVMCNKCNGLKSDQNPIFWLESLDKKTQTKLYKLIKPAISYHVQTIGKNICEVCSRDLAAKSKKNANVKNHVRRMQGVILKKNFGNFFVKCMVFFLVIIPLWWFRLIMKMTGQWNRFISYSAKNKNVSSLPPKVNSDE